MPGLKLNSLGLIGGVAERGNRPEYYQKVLALSPLAYWQLNEKTGNTAYDCSGNGYHGIYSDVSLLATQGPDGQLVPQWLPANRSGLNVYNAAWDTVFPFNEGVLSAWAKVRAAEVWADGMDNWITQFRCTNGQRVGFLNDANTQINVQYSSQSPYWARYTTDISGETDWFHLAVKWSVSANLVRWYLNGVARTDDDGMLADGGISGALGTQSCGIGCIGDGDTGTYWDGYLAHVALFNNALSDAVIGDILANPT